MMTLVSVLLGLLAMATQHSVRADQVCSPEACIKGASSSNILVLDPHSRSALIPGQYLPSSPPSLSSESTSSTSDWIRPLNQSFTPLRSSSSINEGLLISHPQRPAGFSSSTYRGDILPWRAETEWKLEGWKSLYLPPGWYGVIASDGGAGGKVLWGAVRNEKELPGGLGRTVVRAQSSMCNPPCASNGVCLPASTSNFTFGSSMASCFCREGWGGAQCDQCAVGYYGPDCRACEGDCMVCDDGLSGTGACVGTSRDASACNCTHGTCTSDNTCICSAGYRTSTSSSHEACNVCNEGFFQTSNGDCSACPSGCSACRTASDGASPICTSCLGSLRLSTAEQARCESVGSCADGQFWSNGTMTCESCSPTCSTCYGPSPSQCLSCASPRMNLGGQCVGVDSRGVCESSRSGWDGVFVGNNGKGKCDACPAGCAACQIPSFSSVSSFATARCSACADGWLMQDGQCVKRCSEGWFLPPGSAERNGTCERCSSDCASCIGSSTSCTRCASPLSATSGTCAPACPSGTTSTNGTCVACHPDCADCSSPSASSCTACPSRRPVLSNGRCIEYCPRSSYFSPDITSRSDSSGNSNTTSASQQCKACDWTCASCSGPSSRDCTSCNDGFILSSGACVDGGHSRCGTGGFAHGYGVCLSDLVDKADRRWLGFIALPLLIILGVLAWWIISRERRKTRNESQRWKREMDEVDVRKRVEGERWRRLIGMKRVPRAKDGEVERVGEAQDQDQDAKNKKDEIRLRGERKLRELLLPSARRKREARARERVEEEQGVQMSAMGGREAASKAEEAIQGEGRRETQYLAPPPPYAPSSSNREEGPGDQKNGRADAVRPFSRMSISSTFTSTSIPKSAGLPIEARYALKRERAAAEGVEERRKMQGNPWAQPHRGLGATTSSESGTAEPVFPGAQAEKMPGGLLPPLRPAMAVRKDDGYERDERRTFRAGDAGGKGKDEVDFLMNSWEGGSWSSAQPGRNVAGFEGMTDGQYLERMRLSELWPEMDRRRGEGVV